MKIVLSILAILWLSCFIGGVMSGLAPPLLSVKQKRGFSLMGRFIANGSMILLIGVTTIASLFYLWSIILSFIW